jgi:hypothetical protein
VLNGQLVVGGSLDIGNDNIDTAVAQVLSLSVALAAITDDRNLLTFENA